MHALLKKHDKIVFGIKGRHLWFTLPIQQNWANETR